MARSSVIPALPRERLVIIRESFLQLCGGDHCAAALLNDFVYSKSAATRATLHDSPVPCGIPTTRPTPTRARNLHLDPVKLPHVENKHFRSTAGAKAPGFYTRQN